MFNRYFVIGQNGNKTKTYFTTSKTTELDQYVRCVVKSHNVRNDMLIIDWQDKKQVSLLEYAEEVLKVW